LFLQKTTGEPLCFFTPLLKGVKNNIEKKRGREKGGAGTITKRKVKSWGGGVTVRGGCPLWKGGETLVRILGGKQKDERRP